MDGHLRIYNLILVNFYVYLIIITQLNLKHNWPDHLNSIQFNLFRYNLYKLQHKKYKTVNRCEEVVTLKIDTCKCSE